MSLGINVKNFIGDFLGYGRCPVTRDTYWRNEIVSVNYSYKSGILVSARALKESSAEEVARVVFERGSGTPGSSIGGPLYSLEQITEAVETGDVMHLPIR